VTGLHFLENCFLLRLLRRWFWVAKVTAILVEWMFVVIKFIENFPATFLGSDILAQVLVGIKESGRTFLCK
jgi:hypothetical protein